MHDATLVFLWLNIMETEIILRVIIHHSDKETDNILDKKCPLVKTNIICPYGQEKLLLLTDLSII